MQAVTTEQDDERRQAAFRMLALSHSGCVRTSPSACRKAILSRPKNHVRIHEKRAVHRLIDSGTRRDAGVKNAERDKKRLVWDELWSILTR